MEFYSKVLRENHEKLNEFSLIDYLLKKTKTGEVMEIVKKIKPSDKEIIEAIRIRTSECFRAMNIANAIAGYETNEWYLCRNYSLEELKEEAGKRGLEIKGETKNGTT